jgi:hypothetical protein
MYIDASFDPGAPSAGNISFNVFFVIELGSKFDPFS